MIKQSRFFVLVLGLLWVSCFNRPESDRTQFRNEKADIYTSKLFRNQDGTYGYSILKDDREVIKQSLIPAVQGDRGFADSIQAAEVAKLVIAKINKGEFPPSLTQDEIKTIIKD